MYDNEVFEEKEIGELYTEEKYDIKIFEEKDFNEHYKEEMYREEEHEKNIKKIYEFAKKNGYYGVKFEEYMADKKDFNEENENVINDILKNDFQTIKENFFVNYLKKIAVSVLIFVLIYMTFVIFNMVGDVENGKRIFFLDDVIFYLTFYFFQVVTNIFYIEYAKLFKKESNYKKGFIIIMTIIFLIEIFLFDMVHIEIFSIRIALIKKIITSLSILCVVLYLLSLKNDKIMMYLRNKKNKFE